MKSNNNDILIENKIKLLESISLHMELSIRKICKEFKRSKLVFMFCGFSKEGFDCDGYIFDLKEYPKNTIENMVKWVKEENFPLTNCNVGFGLELYITNFDSCSGLGIEYGKLEKISLCYDYSKKLLRKLNNRYLIRDIEYDDRKGCMWMSIEYKVYEHFEKLKKIMKKINS